VGREGFLSGKNTEEVEKSILSSKRSKRKEIEKPMRERLLELGHTKESLPKFIGLQIMHNALKEMVHSKKNNENWLLCLGLKKKGLSADPETATTDDDSIGRDEDGGLYQIVFIGYDSPFSIIITEHILCKVWVVIASCHPSRSGSSFPTPSVPHCHPAYYCPGKDDTAWFERILPHLRCIWKAYKILRYGGKVEYPTKLLRSGEPLYKPTVHWDITFTDAVNKLREIFGGVGTQETANTCQGQAANGGAADQGVAENISGREEDKNGDNNYV